VRDRPAMSIRRLCDPHTVSHTNDAGGSASPHASPTGGNSERGNSAGGHQRVSRIVDGTTSCGGTTSKTNSQGSVKVDTEETL